MRTTFAITCCRSCFCATCQITTKRQLKKNWGRITPKQDDNNQPPLTQWYQNNSADLQAFEKQMRRKVHYVVEPPFLWGSIAEMARKQNDALLRTLQEGFKYIEN